MPTNEQRSHAAAMEMQTLKGKPRAEGYPVSERSSAFQRGYESKAGGGTLASTPAGGFKSDWEVGLRKWNRGA